MRFDSIDALMGESFEGFRIVEYLRSRMNRKEIPKERGIYLAISPWKNRPRSMEKGGGTGENQIRIISVP